MIKIDNHLLSNVSEKAKASARKRMNYNFHTSASDTLQRLVNCLEPGTYCRPHKHQNPDKREVFIILRGKIAVIEFNETGEISDFIVLSHEKGNFCAEIPVRTFHSVLSLESNSAYYEVKDGPYNFDTDKTFATWAPEEGTPESIEYLKNTVKKLNL